MPKISVIIPVYNAESSLRDCLNSIINQNFKDIEIICINDGSVDNSLAILNEYASKEKRLKVITQQNQGVSVARNVGISQAKGEYILFCDADDTYKSNLCSVIATVIDKEGKDVIAYGHENYVDGELEDIDYKNITKIKKTNTLENWLNLQVYIWEKAFKRSFIEKHNIKFPVGIKNAEDLVFCLLVYFSGAQYSLIESALYEYQKERNGLSTFSNPNGIENDTVAYRYLTQTEKFKKLTFKEQRAVTNFFIGGSVRYYKTLKDTEHKEKIINDLQKLYSIILSRYSLIQCLKMKNLRRIHKILFKEKHKKFFNNFNVITTKNKKTVVIFGFNFAVKRKLKNNKISIIIPTLQKDLNILNTLVAELDLDENVGEIIIIDNSLNGYSHKSSKLRVITPKQNIYVNPAWNLGIENAKYNVFGILNDDILLPRKFCIQVLNFINRTKNCGLIGLESSTSMEYTKNSFEDLPETGELKFKKIKHIYDNQDYFWGSSIFGEKENYYNIPEKMKIWCGDDYLLMCNNKAKKKNYAISGIKVKHYGCLSSSPVEFSPIKENDQIFMSSLCPHYKKYYYKQLEKQLEYSFIEKIFSIKNTVNKSHKVITILGIKFKIRKLKYGRI